MKVLYHFIVPGMFVLMWSSSLDKKSFKKVHRAVSVSANHLIAAIIAAAELVKTRSCTQYKLYVEVKLTD